MPSPTPGVHQGSSSPRRPPELESRRDWEILTELTRCQKDVAALKAMIAAAEASKAESTADLLELREETASLVQERDEAIRAKLEAASYYESSRLEDHSRYEMEMESLCNEADSTRLEAVERAVACEEEITEQEIRLSVQTAEIRKRDEAIMRLEGEVESTIQRVDNTYFHLRQ